MTMQRRRTTCDVARHLSLNTFAARTTKFPRYSPKVAGAPILSSSRSKPILTTFLARWRPFQPSFDLPSLICHVLMDATQKPTNHPTMDATRQTHNHATDPIEGWELSRAKASSEAEAQDSVVPAASQNKKKRNARGGKSEGNVVETINSISVTDTNSTAKPTNMTKHFLHTRGRCLHVPFTRQILSSIQDALGAIMLGYRG